MSVFFVDFMSPALAKFLEAIKEKSEYFYPWKNDVITDSVKIEKIGCKHIEFTNVTFREEFSIREVDNENLTITFRKCQFEKYLSLGRVKCIHLIFEDCTFLYLSAYEIYLSTDLHFQYNNLGYVHFHILRGKEFHINNNKEGILNLNRLICHSLDLKDSLTNTNIAIGGEFVPERQSFIKRLLIHFSYNFSGGVTVFDEAIGTLILTGRLEKATLSVADVILESVVITDFVNAGSLKVSRVHAIEKATLTLEDADLGKAVLFGIDFDAFQNISVRHSNVQNIIYSGIKWCRKVDCGELHKMTANQLREIYKQLKNVCSSQNDKPEELRFYGLEMDSYLKELSETKGRKNDKWIIGFNRLTNNHGQTWLRPLGVILALIFITYFPIKVLLGFTDFSYRYIPMALAEMLECLNPVRKFSDSFGLSSPTKTDANTG